MFLKRQIVRVVFEQSIGRLGSVTGPIIERLIRPARSSGEQTISQSVEIERGLALFP
jgi:hypothetical protein